MPNRSRVLCRHLIVAIAPIVGVVLAAQEPPSFRSNVEALALIVQVAAQRSLALPEFTVTDFTVRIGSRTPRVLTAEHLHLTPDQLRTIPYTWFRWPKGEDRAVYLVGVEASPSDCRQGPKVALTATSKQIKVRGVSWAPTPGCAPPNSRIVEK
jgi:hypothetical protein